MSDNENASNGETAAAHCKWVDPQSGVVSRDVFVSDDIHKQEVDRIFSRSWIFLAHESEIPKVGDFVVRNLGDVPVIIVRDTDGGIRGHLNSCRHRGAKLCRGDAGNARRFICPFHGWSYERDGKLITTTFDQHFPKEMNFSEWGLVPITQLKSYHGLIFGCWDANAPSLEEHLGDFRWYFDAFVARSPLGMQVLAPPHRWRAKANWKVGSLNFIGDSQHVLTTHIGPLTLDPVRSARAGLATGAESSIQVMTDGGHGCTFTYLAPGLPAEAYMTHADALVELYAQTLAPDQAKLLDQLRVAVGTVFPNLSFIETQVARGQRAVIIRLWQPVSGTEMEILSWVLAEQEASDEYKENVLKVGFKNFGIAGLFEQDDIELWASATVASNNQIAKRYPYSFHTALPALNSPLPDYKGPGRAYQPIQSEVAQFEFMRHWEKLMSPGL
jgi:phenylpropionate dioxygenase-like ring-hydroxylating dioxygenase large terminal subunit